MRFHNLAEFQDSVSAWTFVVNLNSTFFLVLDLSRRQPALLSPPCLLNRDTSTLPSLRTIYVL